MPVKDRAGQSGFSRFRPVGQCIAGVGAGPGAVRCGGSAGAGNGDLHRGGACLRSPDGDAGLRRRKGHFGNRRLFLSGHRFHRGRVPSGCPAGHTIIPPTGSLVPLEELGTDCRQLQGLSLRNVAVRLYHDGESACTGISASCCLRILAFPARRCSAPARIWENPALTAW